MGTMRAMKKVLSAAIISLLVFAPRVFGQAGASSSTGAGAFPNTLGTKLRKLAGSTDDFVEMTDLTDHGGLPSQPQGANLQYWEWRADGLYFLGATQDTQIRLRYETAYPAFVDGTSAVLIRDAIEPIAFFTAALAAGARGAPKRRAGMMPERMRWKICCCERRIASSTRGDEDGHIPGDRATARLCKPSGDLPLFLSMKK
jgi:hypothetical protein